MEIKLEDTTACVAVEFQVAPLKSALKTAGPPVGFSKSLGSKAESMGSISQDVNVNDVRIRNSPVKTFILFLIDWINYSSNIIFFRFIAMLFLELLSKERSQSQKTRLKTLWHYAYFLSPDQ